MDPALLAQPERWLVALAYASLRPGAALALLPALGGQLIPLRVRIGLAGAVGWLLLEGDSPPRPPEDLLSPAGLAAIAGELLIGLVAALALHAAFAAATIAGEWLAQTMGLGFAVVVDPTTPNAPVLSGLFALLMWALFLGAGGHLLLIAVIVESHAAMPDAGQLVAPERLAAIIGWGGFALASGLIAALPMGAALLLVNLAVGLAARAAPQLNLFAVGFPLLMLAGLAGLPLALPGLAASLSGALAAMQAALAEVLLG
ncbi:MAG: flagellar biosynthetic protein FliR [Sphingomonadaceae bacterium]